MKIDLNDCLLKLLIDLFFKIVIIFIIILKREESTGKLLNKDDPYMSRELRNLILFDTVID